MRQDDYITLDPKENKFILQSIYDSVDGYHDPMSTYYFEDETF